MPCSFANSAFYGCYGSGYECGVVAAVGNSAKNVCSDGRMPVKPTNISQEQMDRFCVELGNRVLVPKDEREFAVVPTELWGLPRSLIPGVHVAVDDLASAFETLRPMAHDKGEDIVMSVQALPFSPFSEAVAPVVSQPSKPWRGFRMPNRPNRGWSFHQADATLEATSLLSSSMLRNTRVKITQAADNLYETADANFASVLVFASQIGVLAKTLQTLVEGPDALTTLDTAMERLRYKGEAFHHGRVESVCQAAIVADVLVLVNSCAPLETRLAEAVIHKAYALAPAAVYAKGACGLADVLKDRAALADANRYWRALTQTPHWPAFKRLVALATEDGARYGRTYEEAQEHGRVLDAWVRSLWHVAKHSVADACIPATSPFFGRASPAAVTSGDVLPCWIDRPKNGDARRRLQRGSPVGLSFSSPCQILALLAGASTIPLIVVQWVRNEGNTLLRVTCSALKATTIKPSAKSTSPVSSDSDSEAFGSFAAKLTQAKLQEEAWRQNNDLLFELVRFSFSIGSTAKNSGSIANFEKISKELTARQRVSTVSEDEVSAREAFERAAGG